MGKPPEKDLRDRMVPCLRVAPWGGKIVGREVGVTVRIWRNGGTGWGGGVGEERGGDMGGVGGWGRSGAGLDTIEDLSRAGG